MSEKPEPSPRPWRAEENVVGWTSFIVDANGDGVAACWRTARGDDEKERQYNEANAALIVDAVNERDRLRDIVRRMARSMAMFDYLGKPELCLIAEARAALGEGENPTGKGVGR